MFATPAYIDHPPKRAARIAVLITLLWLILPQALSLPLGVAIYVFILWFLQAFIIWSNHRTYPKWLSAIFGLFAILAVFRHMGTIFGSEGGSALLLLLISLKALESKVLRDWHIQIAAMIFLIGSTVLLNQSLWIGFWLLISMFAITTCIALFNMPLRPALRQASLALTLTLPLAVVFFIAVPRSSEPLWRIPQTSYQEAKTGLSDTLQPGSISQLVQSDEPAFNAIFDNGQPNASQRYWRVLTMSRFDGEKWLGDNIELDSSAQTIPRGNELSYHIILKDWQGRLPALDFPTLSSANANGHNRMRMSIGQTLAVRSHDGLRRFNLEAYPDGQIREALGANQIHWLTTTDANNPRLAALAQTLKQQSTSSQSLIKNALAYYRQQPFQYTLTPPPTTGTSRIDQFLFNTQQGFCEHYAESFVLLMRHAGLPARIVTGYLGGEYHPEGNFWQIRGKDAHAWAEVWLPESQTWQRVDPTAAVASTRLSDGLNAALPSGEQNLIAGNNSPQWWQNLASRSNFYWQQWVVNFDQESQQSFFAMLGLKGYNLPSLLLFLFIGISLSSIPLILWYRHAKRRTISPLEEGFSLIKARLIEGSDEALAALGPRDTQALLQEHDLLSPELAQHLNQYIQWTYASEVPPSTSQQKKWLKQIQRLLRRHR